MSLLSYAFNPQPGDTADVTQIDSNFAAVQSLVNGGLQASVNVTTAVPVAQNGSTLAEGTASTLARSDHTHILRGVEQLDTEPTTGNFVPREYYDTTLQKKRLCILVNGDGTGNWVNTGNIAGTDLPTHGSRHAQTGADPLSNGGVSSAMLGRTLQTTNLSADTTITQGSWVGFITGVALNVNGPQVLVATASISWHNPTANQTNVFFRLRDTNNNVTLARTGPMTLSATGNQNDQQHRNFAWPLSLSANTTVAVQCFASNANITIDAGSNIGGGGDTSQTTWIKVVVG